MGMHGIRNNHSKGLKNYSYILSSTNKENGPVIIQKHKIYVAIYANIILTNKRQQYW